MTDNNLDNNLDSSNYDDRSSDDREDRLVEMERDAREAFGGEESGKGEVSDKTTSSSKATASDNNKDEGGNVIDVHFDGDAWRIDDESLDDALVFNHLADAEARASELSKETGRGVCVHGQDGELIDTFAAKSQAQSSRQ